MNLNRGPERLLAAAALLALLASGAARVHDARDARDAHEQFLMLAKRALEDTSDLLYFLSRYSNSELIYRLAPAQFRRVFGQDFEASAGHRKAPGRSGLGDFLGAVHRLNGDFRQAGNRGCLISGPPQDRDEPRPNPVRCPDVWRVGERLVCGGSLVCTEGSRPVRLSRKLEDERMYFDDESQDEQLDEHQGEHQSEHQDGDLDEHHEHQDEHQDEHQEKPDEFEERPDQEDQIQWMEDPDAPPRPAELDVEPLRRRRPAKKRPGSKLKPPREPLVPLESPSDDEFSLQHDWELQALEKFHNSAQTNLSSQSFDGLAHYWNYMDLDLLRGDRQLAGFVHELVFAPNPLLDARELQQLFKIGTETLWSHFRDGHYSGWEQPSDETVGRLLPLVAKSLWGHVLLRNSNFCDYFRAQQLASFCPTPAGCDLRGCTLPVQPSAAWDTRRPRAKKD